MAKEDTEQRKPEKEPFRGVPRLPAAIALILIGAIFAVLSTQLVPGPRGLLLLLVLLLLIPLRYAHVRGMHHITRPLGLAITGLVTAAVFASAVLLIGTLVMKTAPPAPKLLLDAALIWITNVLTFAVWYWEIDGGGPAKRHRDRHTSQDFLFPQMTQETLSSEWWSPRFTDYLFLAFNTSTAFSPTDTAALSRRAKALMMVQAVISLVVLGVIAATAINKLG